MTTDDRVNILIVDDQAARLMSYEAILKDLGQNIVRASSGAEALHELMRDEFAVILLDVNMPGMDGFETAQMIHQHPRYEKTPIVFVTAFHVTDMDRLKGYQLGAVDYVFVPVIPAILRSKITVLVELYVKKRELVRLNASLAAANAELALANSTLQVEKTRELEILNANLERTNEELGRSNRDLTAQVAERRRLEKALKEADRRKDEFIAMMAHELRNPLAAIVNGLTLMRVKAPIDPEVVWCSDLLDRQVAHLCRLIEDLLDVSRITHDKIKLQCERVEIGAIIERAVETARPLLDGHRHALTIDVPGEAIAVNGDPTRLVQVVGNLLNNAVKYTPDGGQIQIAVAREADHVVLRVKDSGVGVPEEMLPKLFELFTQFERTLVRSHGGLGIGLALVRRLVELHGGRVWARSEGAGAGSEFFVSLPVLSGAAQLEGSGAKDGGAPRVHVGRRILVVDDNIDAAESLMMVLHRYRYDVKMANSGEEALRVTQAFVPEVILLDLGMPGMNGYEAARHIRRLPGGDQILLIALTGWSQSDAREATLEAGFDRHWVKPLDLAELQKLLDGLPQSATSKS